MKLPRKSAFWFHLEDCATKIHVARGSPGGSLDSFAHFNSAFCAVEQWVPFGVFLEICEYGPDLLRRRLNLDFISVFFNVTLPPVRPRSCHEPRPILEVPCLRRCSYRNIASDMECRRPLIVHWFVRIALSTARTGGSPALGESCQAAGSYAEGLLSPPISIISPFGATINCISRRYVQLEAVGSCSPRCAMGCGSGTWQQQRGEPRAPGRSLLPPSTDATGSVLLGPRSRQKRPGS